MEDRVFDSIVSDFYRAATGALPWDRALDGVVAAFSARTAVLHTADTRNGQILSMNHGGPPIHDAMLDYVREYHRVDPRRFALLERLPEIFGQLWHCHENFSEEFVAGQRFYQEFTPAYDSRYLSMVPLNPAEHVFTAFALELPTSRGVLSTDERDLFRRLAAHMGEALRAHERVRRMAVQAMAGHGLLNSFPYPMCLIDRDRFISFENPAATTELEKETLMARRGARLALTRGRADQQFTDRLLALSQDGQGANAVIDLRATAADHPPWLHLSLLVPDATMGAFGAQPQFLATLFDPQQVSLLDPFALANMFNLTPTEAKVAAHLAEGFSAEQISVANGTAITTARTHISQVIAKLGARRSIDVVRMLRQGEALWASAGTARR